MIVKKGFKGNPLLRKAGMVPEGGYTQERIAEFIRCANDPIYFFEHYVKIKHVDFEKKVFFKPRGYQLKMTNSILENRYTISRWPRQSGKTTVIASIALHYLLFNQNYSILIAAHKGDKAQEIVTAIQDMYMELPDWLQQGIVEWNKKSFKLENGSRIRSSTTSSSSARGDTYNLVALDEFAFVPTHVAEEFVKSVIPTVSSGKDTKIIITSTPKGLNLFYSIWKDAEEQKIPPPNNFVPIAVEWNEVPGRDEKFKEGIIKQYGQEFWDQEFACAFLGSSRTLISANKLLILREETPLHQYDNARVYMMPEKGHHYAITVDVAEGLGGDATVVMCVDITTAPYQVAYIYENRHIEMMSLPSLIHTIARNYNEALVLVESNFGQMVADMLWYELEYENVVMTTRNVKTPGGQKVTTSGNTRPGLQMNVLSKRIGCSNLKSLVENDQLILKDKALIEQLRRFAVKGKSYAAEQGHDDIAMAAVMFAWLVDQGYVKEINDINIRENIANINRDRIENAINPFGFIVTGTETNNAPVASASNDWKWLIGNENDPEPDPVTWDTINRLYGE